MLTTPSLTFACFRSLVSLERNAETAEAPAQPSPTDLFLKLPLGLLLRACSVPGFEKSDMGWDLTPSSMERLLTCMWDRCNRRRRGSNPQRICFACFGCTC